MRLIVVVAFASVMLAVAVTGARVAVRPIEPRALPGWALYDRTCLACHGASGDGRGPAAPYTWGQPRPFSRGAYKWRSTPIGQPPSDDDLRAAIRHGAPGTSMSAFALTDVEIDQLIEVLKAFEPKTFAKPGKPITFAPTPARNTTRGAQLWTQHGCDKCHGNSGRGDGPSAAGLSDPPYDLTTQPLRRPRAADDLESRRRAAMTSIATGLAAMPGYAGVIPDADLWALADHVVSIGAQATTRGDRSKLDQRAIDADRTTKISTGTWPATDVDESRVFGAALHPQGPVPPHLAPAETSLRARQCARCHAKQAREWQGSVHAAASSWGLGARELDLSSRQTGLSSRRTGHAMDGEASTCNRCHTPLAEQQPGAAFDAELRTEGVTCAGCHVRDWVKRGPPRRAPSLLPASGYPLVELAIYERADFCLPCHQLPPRSSVNGKPLLNTYKEWLEGPYMARGIQCQHCHMPNREHTWLGIHDRDTFRQGIRLDTRAHRKDGAVTVVATLANVGAGHYLPTTPTPAVWLRIELFDGAGRAILGARAELRIGRDIEFTTAWQENSDTRIPPGEHVTLARAWSKGRTADAKTARITIEVAPDDYYERLYAARLGGKVPNEARKPYEDALARAKASHYIAEQHDVPIALSPK